MFLRMASLLLLSTIACATAWSDSSKKPPGSRLSISSAGSLLRTESGLASHAILQDDDVLAQVRAQAATSPPCTTKCLDDGDFCQQICIVADLFKADIMYAHFADGACSDIAHNPFSELVGDFDPDIYAAPAAGLPPAAEDSPDTDQKNPHQITSDVNCNPHYIVRTHATNTLCETFCANVTAVTNYVAMLNAAATAAGKDSSVNTGTCAQNTNFTEFVAPSTMIMFGKPATDTAR